MAIGVRQRVKEGEAPKPTRFYSSKQEKTVAKAIGGRQTANSGATPWQKGDVTTKGANGFLIECKTKTSASESISIKKEWKKFLGIPLIRKIYWLDYSKQFLFGKIKI